MNMIKKQGIAGLITFVFICLISVNVFASTMNYQQPTTYNTPQDQVQQQQTQQPVQTYQQPENTTNTNVPQEEKKIEGDAALPVKQKTELLNLQEQSRDALEKYKEKYKNNAIYGTIAYVLNIVRLAAVPFFVVGYLISIVYEFIIGMKRREMVRKGRGMRITLISTFVMAQVLPLIFAIVIKFWGN